MRPGAPVGLLSVSAKLLSVGVAIALALAAAVPARADDPAGISSGAPTSTAPPPALSPEVAAPPAMAPPKSERSPPALSADVASLAAPASPPTTPSGPARRSTCYPTGEGRITCYERPGIFDFLLQAPGNLGRFLLTPFQKENALWTAGVVASTGGLLLVDQPLVDNTRKAMHHLGISSTGKQKDIIAGIPVQYPTDAGSAIYYLGDGMIPAVVLAGVLGYGVVASDDRALLTASHLGSALLASGVTCQVIKHVTGRQTPLRATEDGGKWQWLPNPRDYGKNVPNYDAFPSGHIATAMVTVEVLAEDYPEYRYIRPLGYALMVPLAFQMLNNGVHWMSDYPVGLAIGYGLAHQAVQHGRRPGPAQADAAGRGSGPGVEVSFAPMPVAGGGGLSALGTF